MWSESIIVVLRSHAGHTSEHKNICPHEYPSPNLVLCFLKGCELHLLGNKQMILDLPVGL